MNIQDAKSVKTVGRLSLGLFDDPINFDLMIVLFKDEEEVGRFEPDTIESMYWWSNGRLTHKQCVEEFFLMLKHIVNDDSLTMDLKLLLSMKIDINEYQTKAIKTAIYGAGNKIVYPTLGLAGEAGELANKVKKVLRDNSGEFTPEKKEEIAYELGDILWYCAALANDLGYTLGELAQANLDKLKSRQERNVIGGSGDNR